MAAQRLVERLLEDLRRDAAEVLRVDVDFHRLADLRVGLDGTSLGQRNLVVRLRDFFATRSRAMAVIFPVFGSNATVMSRAGPKLLRAAAKSAVCTASRAARA